MRGKIGYHARSHGPGGSDPITIDAIQFDVENVGDWLSIETTTAGAPFGGGVTFNVGAGDFNVFALAGQVYLDAERIFLGSETGDMEIDSQEDIQIHSRGGGANIWDIVGPLLLAMGDNFDVSLLAGKSVTYLDHLGNPIFRVDEDGSIHSKTGGTITADL